MAQAALETSERSGFMQYTRGGGTEIQTPFEKPVVVPALDNKDAAAHAWAEEAKRIGDIAWIMSAALAARKLCHAWS